jgi:hypothetical protein
MVESAELELVYLAGIKFLFLRVDVCHITNIFTRSQVAY